MLSTIRPSRHSTGPDLEAELMTCALCRSASLPDVETHFEPALLELADRRYRGLALQETLLIAAQANGHRERHLRVDIGGALHAAFSSTRLSDILSSVANKFLLAGFTAIESAWREIAAIRSVNDFKPVESYRLTGANQYQRVAHGGELTHGRLGEERYHNQADTYGRMLSITRQDLINDDLGALTTPAKLLGRGAALALNEVFWTTFLEQSDFFTLDNGNLIAGTGSVLNIDGLTTAEVAFLEKRDSDGAPLGLDPAILLVPPALSAQAFTLMTSLEVRCGTGPKAYPTTNPHAGKFRVVRSVYLSTPSVLGGSETAWYLLANPQDAAVIEVAFLDGNEAPIIEHADADLSTLGIQMRGFHDFGISKQDHRAGVKMMGA